MHRSARRSADHREESREAVDRGAVGLQIGTGHFIARLVNKSYGGISVELERKTRIGQEVTVTLAPRHVRMGKICWRRDGRTGIRFV